MRHTLKYVCHVTSLSPHVIRVWEKRYQVVTPMRCVKNRRFYTSEDVDRLRALARLTKTGYRISELAVLPTEKLNSMAQKAQETELVSVHAPPLTSKCTVSLPTEDVELVQACLAAVEGLDAPQLRLLLQQSLNERGCQGALQRVLMPLLCEIGERWTTGEMRIVHEHFATMESRQFLGECLSQYGAPVQGAGELIFTTTAGQMHEMGAFLAATMARNAGWNVTYLGPSLPAEEIASAARTRRASAVALSLVFPESDPATIAELRRLRALLPGLPLLIGGRATPGYMPVLLEIGACIINTYEDYDRWLKEKKPVAAAAAAASV